MINWDKKKRYILGIVSIILFFVLIIYIIIIRDNIKRKNFTDQLIEIVNKNEQQTFSIKKIYLCSSANAIDISENKNLSLLDIYQYTDIVVYIDNLINTEELTNKNTVKELYIDNIETNLEKKSGSIQSLSYINLLKTGTRENLENLENSRRIDFKIIYKNDEEVNYDEPTFYTDCSNPISLRYINNLGANYSLEEDISNNAVNFDGSILSKAGITLEDINCKIKFKINIVNNNDENFSCWLNFKIPLDGIDKGTLIKSANTKGTKYNFFSF